MAGVILTTGSRSWSDLDVLDSALTNAVLDLKHAGHTEIIVRQGGQGNSRIFGADYYVREWVLLAQENSWPQGIDLELSTVYAQWSKYGRGAGMIRNREMVDNGLDIGLVFWDGKSPGTKQCMEYMKQQGHSPRIFRSDDAPDTISSD